MKKRGERRRTAKQRAGSQIFSLLLHLGYPIADGHKHLAQLCECLVGLDRIELLRLGTPIELIQFELNFRTEGSSIVSLLAQSLS